MKSSPLPKVCESRMWKVSLESSTGVPRASWKACANVVASITSNKAVPPRSMPATCATIISALSTSPALCWSSSPNARSWRSFCKRSRRCSQSSTRSSPRPDLIPTASGGSSTGFQSTCKVVMVLSVRPARRRDIMSTSNRQPLSRSVSRWWAAGSTERKTSKQQQSKRVACAEIEGPGVWVSESLGGENVGWGTTPHAVDKFR
mmetsp:Transcript_55084/g.147021  ORF Transcript_55084/g.147021 Transcript_55084/m.147021 type:complete len:204 (+) Transcript_55084:805-1416(+)